MRAKNKTTQVLLAAGALLIIAAVCYDRDSDADVRHFSNPADI